MFICLKEASANRKVAGSIKHIGTAKRLERTAIHNYRASGRILNDCIGFINIISVYGASEVSFGFNKPKASSATDQFAAINN